MHIMKNVGMFQLCTHILEVESSLRDGRDGHCDKCSSAALQNEKRKENYASSKKLLTSTKEQGPLGKKSPFTRKEKVGQ